jgi:hypothetical protein
VSVPDAGVPRAGEAPNDISEDAVTALARVVPVRVPAGATTVLSLTAVINPFPLTVSVGMDVEEPKLPVFVLTVARVVALPLLVKSPVRFALVVTCPAVKLAAVPVNPVPAPSKTVPVIVVPVIASGVMLPIIKLSSVPVPDDVLIACPDGSWLIGRLVIFYPVVRVSPLDAVKISPAVSVIV